MIDDEPTSAPQPLDAAAAALLEPWTGPYDGLPPFDKARPDLIEPAYRAAIERKRAEVEAISANPERPTFANTIAALEASGAALRRIQPLLQTYVSTLSDPAIVAMQERLAPLGPALDDAIAHDERLFARVNTVFEALPAANLEPEERRLTTVLRERFLRHGAALTPDAKRRLARINGRLAELQGRFVHNLTVEKDAQFVLVADAAELAGLSEAVRAAASAAARARGFPAAWAFNNERPAVMAVLATSACRGLRERVWRMWFERGAHAGPTDNRPIVAELLKRRGEKARLLGYPNFADFATANRMAGSPRRALELLTAVWARIVGPTRAHLAELQVIADAAGDGVPLEPWDRYYYAERLRQTTFGLDAESLMAYLSVDGMLDAALRAASKLHGVTFRVLPEAPVYDPTVRVYGVDLDGAPLGVIYFDLFARPGKMHGSWQNELRTGQRSGITAVGISGVYSGMPSGGDGPALIGWEHARVLFHEFGHAMHMLLNQSRFPSLASAAVAWDVVEVPSLLNERWLEDPELLQTFARHHLTGEALPLDMIERIEAGIKADRVFTLTLDFLAMAIVDMRLHLAADGSDVDAEQIERDVLDELAMPHAIDPIMRVMQLYHSFATDVYAGGVYVYLWSEVMAADAAEAFLEAPGGLYDAKIADRYRQAFLAVGHRVPADEAYRAFRGRDPDPEALPRRFGLRPA